MKTALKASMKTAKFGPELLANGVIGVAGAAGAATYNPSTGVGTASRVDGSNQSYVSFAVVIGKTYQIDVQNTGATSITIRNTPGNILATVSVGQRNKIILKADSLELRVAPVVNGSTVNFVVHSIREII